MSNKFLKKVLCVLFRSRRELGKKYSYSKRLVKKLWKDIDYLEEGKKRYYDNWKKSAVLLQLAMRKIDLLKEEISLLKNKSEDAAKAIEDELNALEDMKENQ